MNKLYAKAAALTALAAFTASMAVAAPHKKPKAAGATCPVCHMALTTKKTKMNSVAVPMGKKTMYCCNKCDMKSKH